MQLDLHYIFEKDGKFIIGYCLEIPEANGQGATIEDCRRNLEAAIELVMEDRVERGLAGVPKTAKRKVVALSEN
jgi:predicted RNase H-like HicB family nuclease